MNQLSFAICTFTFVLVSGSPMNHDSKLQAADIVNCVGGDGVNTCISTFHKCTHNCAESPITFEEPLLNVAPVLQAPYHFQDSNHDNHDNHCPCK